MRFMRSIMKNLKPYDFHDTSIGNSSYGFFETVLNSKRDVGLKTYFQNNETIINSSHQLFDTKFANNLLSEINASNSSILVKDNFEKLYSYKNRNIKKLRLAIQSLQDNSSKHKCQYCTINNHDTLDHFLPKSKYWEYIIHPLNLIPCCSDCNRRLLAKEDSFLNLYLDILPTGQYLFVEITFTNNIPDFNYYLQNINGINPAIFSKIEQHFESLGLLERMKLAAIGSYDEFCTTVKGFLSYLNMIQIRDSILISINNSKISYGHNHWKYIFQEALINSQTFINLL